MCGPLFAVWAGRHNNGPINERPSDLRGGNVNTRMVKLQQVKNKQGDEEENRNNENDSKKKTAGLTKRDLR
jgi:hypothetical protein